MPDQKTKTFWDIEKEKTWRIYVLFAILLLFYFVPISVIWIVVKFLIHIRQSVYQGDTQFNIFGFDTWFVLITAGVAAAFHWYYSNKKVVSNILLLLGAQYPDKNDRYHYVFQNVVDEIETAAGGLKVERYILPTGAMNAFALADLNGRYVIGITEGLLSRLNREELQSVVAHEMSHIISNDCLQSTIVCSLFSIYSEALAHFNKAISKTELRSSSIFKGETQNNANATGLLSLPVALLLFNKLDEHEDYFAMLFSTHPPLVKRLQIILDFAHADLAEITQYLKRDKGLKIEPEMIKPRLKFLAEHENKWVGPFTIIQLQSFDWLDPETKLRIEGVDEIFIANEIPSLNYFFHKRDEPIWRIRRLCPDCREWLIVQEYEGLYVWRCAFCNGVLVEGKKLPRIIVRKEKGFTERVQRFAQLLRKNARKRHPHFNIRLSVLHPRKCPKCGKNMVHKFYSYAYHIEIDTCSACNITWFDPDELEILQYLIEMEEE
jgi:Zn-dependent protease with chaperone function/Zn-finger nucleic acid-binding protein